MEIGHRIIRMETFYARIKILSAMDLVLDNNNYSDSGNRLKFAKSRQEQSLMTS